MDIWQHCSGARYITPISGTLIRLVESQQQVATLSYVDTLEEQALLEEMLEGVKPDHYEPVDGYHYLLKSPFRYPPLRWGSRFGREHEPSLLYGAQHIDTVLAESAYYRFLFWYSMDASAPKTYIRSQHSSFAVNYRTRYGVRLQQPPFASHRELLVSPQDYSTAQRLGTQMRAANVQAFEFHSARDVGQGICVALFSVGALAQKKPQRIRRWLCELSAHQVTFKALDSSQLYKFELAQFLCDGELALPA